MKFFEKTRDVLGRRPWLPAAVYLFFYGLFALTILTAVANLVPGEYRLWEELDKDDLAIVARISGAIGRVMIIYAMLLVVVPLLFLMKRGVRSVALRVWGYGVGAIVSSIVLAFLIAPIVFVGCLELDSADRENGDAIEEIQDGVNSVECGLKNDASLND